MVGGGVWRGEVAGVWGTQAVAFTTRRVSLHFHPFRGKQCRSHSPTRTSRLEIGSLRRQWTKQRICPPFGSRRHVKPAELAFAS